MRVTDQINAFILHFVLKVQTMMVCEGTGLQIHQRAAASAAGWKMGCKPETTAAYKLFTDVKIKVIIRLHEINILLTTSIGQNKSNNKIKVTIKRIKQKIKFK